MSKDKKNNLPKAKPVNPEIDEQEKEIAKSANRAFEQEQNTLRAPLSSKEELAGVPMSEELSADKVEEYCKREPWILTDLKSAPHGSRFGTITARFNYLAKQSQKAGNTQDAQKYMQACKEARALYFKQLRKDFRILESSMNRQDIGVFAQNLWTHITQNVSEPGANIVRFVGSEKANEMSGELKELVRSSIHANTKWLALNINEIPLNKSAANKPKPIIH